MKTKNIVTYIFETERLYLRPFSPDDYENLFKLHTNQEVMRFIPLGVRDKLTVKKDLKNCIDHQAKHGFSKYACFLKETNEFIGRAGFSLMDNGEIEVGYSFFPEYWGKGYATETLIALLDWGFSNLKIDLSPK